MNQHILDFLSSQRTCVLSVEMMDGAPHAATVHFAICRDPLVFYFETNKSYRKAEVLFGREISRASLVVGTTEDPMKTFQADGAVRLIEDSEMETYQKLYLGKFPEKLEKSQQRDFVRFLFISSWWRFTDWKTPQGKLILTSQKE